MNIKLKRTTRTPYSEEISIYDIDTRDLNDQPVSIGKIDVHYVDDQVVATLLLWEEFAAGFRQSGVSETGMTLDEVIDEILTEVSDPVGVSATYAVEVYYPSFSGQGFVSNYPDEDEESEDSKEELSEDEYLADEEEQAETGEEEYTDEQDRKEDEFADRLRQRP